MAHVSCYGAVTVTQKGQGTGLRRRTKSSSFSAASSKLDIQVLYVEGVVFDELSAGFYVLAHQRGEDGFALGDVFELYRQ